MREGAVGIGENGCDRMKKVFMMFADPGSEFRFGERKNGVEAQFCGIGGEIKSFREGYARLVQFYWRIMRMGRCRSCLRYG